MPFLKKYEIVASDHKRPSTHIIDIDGAPQGSRKIYALCGERIFDYAFKTIDAAFEAAQIDDNVVVCSKCWDQIKITIKTSD